MMIACARAALCAVLIVLAGLPIPVRAVEIPIKIPGCPERDGTDLSKSDSDVEARRAQDDQSICGGGGAGSDAAYAYPGVRSPAVSGGGGGGEGGGTTTRTAAPQTGGTDPTAGQSSGSTGVIQSTQSSQSTVDNGQSTSGAGTGGAPAPQPTTNGSLIQTGSPTPNTVNSTRAAGGFGDSTFGESSTSVGHVAPMPDLGDGLSWLVALIAAAFFCRRRIRV